MDIVVINLDVHTERWRESQARFAALHLSVTRLSAVNGQHLPICQREQLQDAGLNRRQHHKPLRPGEIGCYASHMAVWRQLLDTSAPMLAVFEDDIEPSPALPTVLRAIESAAPDWDLIKLFGRSRERVRERMTLAPQAELVAYHRVPSHTCAYVVSRRGAQKLLASRLPFGRPIDVDIRHWWENDLQVRGVLPYPVREAECSLTSTIDDGRRGVSSAPMRLHKLYLQLRYTLLNRYHAGVVGSAHDASRHRANDVFGEPTAPRDAT